MLWGVVIDNKYGSAWSEFCFDAARGPYGVCQFDSGNGTRIHFGVVMGFSNGQICSN